MNFVSGMPPGQDDLCSHASLARNENEIADAPGS